MAAAALAALIALSLYHRSHHHVSARAPTTLPQPAPKPHTTATVVSSAATAPTATTTAAAPSKPANVISLELTAARGDSWVEVRAGSESGRVLYAQTLAAGRTARFEASRLWVRFGAASNLDALLRGKPLRLPVGTYSALVTPRGLGHLGP